jgi:hypothetical protein
MTNTGDYQLARLNPGRSVWYTLVRKLNLDKPHREVNPFARPETEQRFRITILLLNLGYFNKKK